MSKNNKEVFLKLIELERKYGEFKNMNKKQKEQYLKIFNLIHFNE